MACQLGVLAGIPCIGVGKKLYFVDGLTKGPLHKEKVHCVVSVINILMSDVIKSTHPQINTTLHKKGDYFDLIGESGRVWGVVSTS